MNVVMPNSGILIEEFNPFVFQMLKKEALAGIESINKNIINRNGDLLSMFHQDLPKELYFKEIDKCKDAVYQEVLTRCAKLEASNPEYTSVLSYYGNEFDEDTPKPELFVERTWINYQRPGEFVPLHQHSGVFSFVVWIQLPFNYSKSFAPDTVSKTNHGQFEFVYIDILGKIRTMLLAPDNTWEGKIAVFPASMYHQVYPHYADDFRITISGNIRAKL